MGFGSTDDILVSSSFQLNSWNHFAVVRSGSATNNVSVFLNGSRVHQRTDTTNFSTNSAPYLASRYNATETLLGYASNFRVLKGVAQYSGSTYTVPTAPLTAVSGTSLLLNFTNAGIFDNTGFNTFETFENSATTTALTKYGHGSMYFDGTNDYLIAQTGTIPAIRTGDFTVECWTYLPYVTPTACWRALISIGNGHQTAGAFTLYAPRADAVIGSAVVIINQVNPTLGGTTSINDRQWHHVAVTRSGTTLRLFVDGVLQASTSNSADITQTQVVIGRDINCSTTYFQGYIDDARITVGVARYTANFTPPPARFPNQ